MSKLEATVSTIELANYDTQLKVTDVTMNEVEILLEHDTEDRTDFVVGNFTMKEMRGLANLLYLRYYRNVDINGTVVKYNAEQ